MSLKELRERQGISQKALSEQSGVSIRTIQGYEQGAKNIKRASEEILLKLAKALDCPMDDLLKETIKEDNKDYLTVDEAAEILHVSRKTVLNLASENLIPVAKKTAFRNLFLREDLMEYKNYLTSKEAAKILSVSERMINYLAMNHQLPVAKKTERRNLFLREDVMAFMERKKSDKKTEDA